MLQNYKYQPSAEEVVILTVHLINTYDTEGHEKLNYARISRATLRNLSLRVKLEHEGFIDKWLNELANFGWSGFYIGDEFGLMRTEVTDTWPKLPSFRIRGILATLRRNDPTPIVELREQFFPLPEAEEDE